MPHYKDADGNLHWLDNSSFESRLPLGSYKIPDEIIDNFSLLSNSKLIKKHQIESERDVQIAQDVTVHGRPWDADKRSQENLSNEILTTQAGVQMSPIWRDANNDNMILTNIQQLVDIAAVMKTQTLTAYMTSWVRKAAVDAATTAEEVALI